MEENRVFPKRKHQIPKMEILEFQDPIKTQAQLFFYTIPNLQTMRKETSHGRCTLTIKDLVDQNLLHVGDTVTYLSHTGTPKLISFLATINQDCEIEFYVNGVKITGNT
jgi:hypothetical protein